jgi:transcriptional regulator with XRE-family HTH domain
MSRKSLLAANTGSFGALVRSARSRQQLSLVQAAARAGTSASHLSRLERGERTALSRDLLARLASTLDVQPGELFAAAGLLPPTIERELADPELALALADGDRLPFRTREMLRRRHLAALAERLFGAPAAGAVDVERLLRDKGYTVVPAIGPERSLVFDGLTLRYHGETPEIERFLLSHALAHIALEAAEGPSCGLHGDAPSPAADELEGEATTLAAFILVPTSPLAIAVREESERYKVWLGGTGPLLEAVAGRFGAPAWLVARRVSEEGFFADAAELRDL